MPQVKCKICDKEFYVKPSHQKLGYGQYCSRVCMHLGQRKGKWMICHVCGKETWKTPKDIKGSKSGKFFCNKSCSTLWRNKLFSGKKHPNWRGGEYTYRRLMKTFNFPLICKKCGIHDQRVLVVHHLDRNRKNNKVENLIWLCHNCHFLVHNHNMAAMV